MNGKKIVLFVLLADFLAVAAWATSKVGVIGLFTGTIESPAAIVGLADLVISLGLICTWMLRDARARGTSALPYVILTPVLGSAAALLYLLRRPDDAPDPVATSAAVRSAAPAR
jgi:hypothetical protein